MTGRGFSIEVSSCAKTFADGNRALSPLSFAIDGGETIAFLGPSGCGKTTLLRIIAGLVTPDPGGRVLFDGRDVTRIPIERRNVGMVFQSYALFPNMPVLDNVAYGLKVKGMPRPERQAQARAVLEMMRIGDLGLRRIDQLSGGQKQRVALARAIAVKPNVLLLDEPLTALDASLRDELRTEIDRLLRGLKITSVYVTHDQAEAMVLADRIFVMEKGNIAQIGTPRDIYFRPANGFVANFVGTMNRLDGAISGGRFETAAGSMAIARPDAAAVSACFRPERAAIAEPHDAPFTFRLDRVHFLGDAQRLYLTRDGGAGVIVDAPNTAQYAPGATVGLRISPDDLLFL